MNRKLKISLPVRMFVLVAAVLAVTTVLGCGGHVPLAQVEGTVRLNDRPAGNMLVTFFPDPAKGTAGPCSRAVTDSEGHYRLQCEDERFGAVIGWHRIVIEDFECYQASRKEDAPPGPASRLPKIYQSAVSTPLQEQVSSGLSTIDLNL